MQIRETDELFSAVAAELNIPDPSPEEAAAALEDDTNKEEEQDDGNH